MGTGAGVWVVEVLSSVSSVFSGVLVAAWVIALTFCIPSPGSSPQTAVRWSIKEPETGPSGFFTQDGAKADLEGSSIGVSRHSRL